MREKMKKMEQEVGHLVDMGVRIHMPLDYEDLTEETRNKYLAVEAYRKMNADANPKMSRPQTIHDIRSPDIDDDEDIARYKREVKQLADDVFEDEMKAWRKEKLRRSL